MVLTRRKTEVLQQGRVPGRSPVSVNVEVRKRRTYVKRSEQVAEKVSEEVEFVKSS